MSGTLKSSVAFGIGPRKQKTLMRDAITEALANAQKDDDKTRLSTLRLIHAAIKDRDVSSRTAGRDPVSEEDVLQILLIMRKQRLISAHEYEESGRLELAEQEREESTNSCPPSWTRARSRRLAARPCRMWTPRVFAMSGGA